MGPILILNPQVESKRDIEMCEAYQVLGKVGVFVVWWSHAGFSLGKIEEYCVQI